jgi:outer membrane beta-barrel protein
MRVLFLILSVFLAGQSAHAASPPEQTEQDEYDFSWLDPEKKIYVVQNRKYLKKGRLEVALAGGVGMGEPYRTRRVVMPRGIFYVNENWGLSAFGGFVSNSENGNVQAMQDAGANRIPAVRDVQNYIGGSVMWLPFYGKINMFNQIFYIDWHLEAGLAQTSTEIDLNTRFNQSPQIQESTHMGYLWGTGWKFFVTRNFGARLDFQALYYKAPTGVDGNLLSAAGSMEDTYDNYFVTLGLSYTF